MHRVASLMKRWLMGTHQGSVKPEHAQSYLDEFCFRFNRRGSKARGMLFYRLLQLAAGADRLTYRDLVASPKPKRVKPEGVLGPLSRARHPRRARPRQAIASGCTDCLTILQYGHTGWQSNG